MISRRQLFTAALAASVFKPVWAQSYPNRVVHFIVPYPAGGITDLVARKLGERLSASWGQSVVIDNRPGAGGNIAAQMAARAAPDGYTIYMGFLGTHAANISLYPSLGFDPVRDFTPVSLVANAPMVLTVNPSVPVRTAQDFVAYARANPGKLNFGSSGNGGASHLALELFKSVAKVDIVHVPYKGTAPIIVDLLAGRIQGYFDVPITAYQNAAAGRTLALAVADTRRSARMPNVPTAAEVGMPDFVLTTWLGVLAPAGLPAPILAQMNSDIVAIAKSADFASFCADKGLNALSSTPEEFAGFMAAETTKFAKVIKGANIRLN